MKIAMTGHTSVLGSAIKNSFDADGYSRSNGWDILDEEIRVRLIKELNSYDVFLNFAYNKMVQTNLLFDWFYEYKDTNKTIVNFGSRASHTCEYRGKLHDYSVYKKTLEAATKQLQNVNSTCRIILLSPGYIDDDNISIEDTIDVLKFVLEERTFYVNEICFYPRNSK